MKKREYRINVYENKEGDAVIARVRYNAVLDYWDGHSRNNGGPGKHKGITKLKDGRYVIIHGGARDFGYVVSAEEALQEILKADRGELLKTKKYKDLRALYDNTMAAMAAEADDED